MDNLLPPLLAEEICFGLDRKTDDASLVELLVRFSRPPLLATLVPRLSEQEIDELVELTGKLLHRHLKHHEYHQLFLSNY